MSTALSEPQRRWAAATREDLKEHLRASPVSEAVGGSAEGAVALLHTRLWERVHAGLDNASVEEGARHVLSAR